MRALLLLLAALSFSFTSRAEEPRVARFDIQRVFDGYQRTEDLQKVISSRRHPMGPRSVTPRMERADKLDERYDDLQKRMEVAEIGTPERERLEVQVQLATLAQQIDKLQAAVERQAEIRQQESEVDRQRSEILREIHSVAMFVGEEGGYRVLVPEARATNVPAFPVVLFGPAEDLTEKILARLNAQYAEKKLK